MVVRTVYLETVVVLTFEPGFLNHVDILATFSLVGVVVLGNYVFELD